MCSEVFSKIWRASAQVVFPGIMPHQHGSLQPALFSRRACTSFSASSSGLELYLEWQFVLVQMYKQPGSRYKVRSTKTIFSRLDFKHRARAGSLHFGEEGFPGVGR